VVNMAFLSFCRVFVGVIQSVSGLIYILGGNELAWIY
jgi:hypothetical protein